MQQALSAALADPDCRWISLTTAATAYGSEVVDRVLRPPPEGAAQADILMAPLDSKHFAQQGEGRVRVAEQGDQDHEPRPSAIHITD